MNAPAPPARTDGSLLDAVHGQPPVQGQPAPAGEGRGHALLDAGRPPDPRRRGRPLVRQRGPRPPRDHRGGRAADRHDGVRAAVPDGTPDGLPAGERGGELAAQGHGAHLLHQLGFGIGRHRAQDRARLSPRARRSITHALHRPRARLSRRRVRRHLRRRHGQQPQVVRLDAAGRRSPAAHARSGEERLHARHARTRRQPGRRTRAHRRAARRQHHRGRDRRARRGLHRRAAFRPRATWSACAASAPSTASC